MAEPEPEVVTAAADKTDTADAVGLKKTLEFDECCEVTKQADSINGEDTSELRRSSIQQQVADSNCGAF